MPKPRYSPTFLALANGHSTYLTNPLNETQTTVTVADTTGFPTPGTDEYVPVAVDDEVMHVTGIPSAFILTVVRGQDGTTAAAHDSAAGVVQALTTAAIEGSYP